MLFMPLKKQKTQEQNKICKALCMSVEILSDPGHGYSRGAVDWQPDLLEVLNDVSPLIQTASSVLPD